MADKQPWIIQWSLRLGVLQDAEGELGDILEEHAGGRSVFWLWRQVLSLALRRKTRPVHQERRAEMFSSLRNDVRYGVRSLGHNVGFTAAAVMTIALGIGINTGIFSILNGALLRSLPVPDAGRLISVHQDFQGVRQRNVNGARSMFSTSEYRSYRDRNQTLTGLMAYSVGGPSSMVTLGGDQPQEVRGILVTCNYFDVLQVKPAKGVGFNGNNCDVPEEQPIVVLGHDLWMNAFGADPGIIGKSVTLNRIRFAVVGVAPEGFHGTELLKFQFFVPLSLQRTLTPNRDFYNDENASWLTLVGRRKDGVAIEQVRADLSVISNQIDQQQPGRTTTLILQHATSFPLPVARSGRGGWFKPPIIGC